MTLVACLSELGATSARAIAKLAGLAPHDDDSGKRHGPRTIWGGRSPVRRALYLSAFTAVRCNPQFKAFFSRLTARGLPFKAAVIAAARKLAVLANTLIAQNRTWSPEPPKPA